MTTIDRNMAKTLANEAREALEAIAARHGLEVKVGGGTFDPGEGIFRPKVEFQVSDHAERAFRADAFLVGLSADDFGREFTSNGKRFRVSGVNLRAQRFPVMADEIGTDRKYKFAAAAVLAKLEAQS